LLCYPKHSLTISISWDSSIWAPACHAGRTVWPWGVLRQERKLTKQPRIAVLERSTRSFLSSPTRARARCASPSSIDSHLRLCEPMSDSGQAVTLKLGTESQETAASRTWLPGWQFQQLSPGSCHPAPIALLLVPSAIRTRLRTPPQANPQDGLRVAAFRPVACMPLACSRAAPESPPSCP